MRRERVPVVGRATAGYRDGPCRCGQPERVTAGARQTLVWWSTGAVPPTTRPRRMAPSMRPASGRWTPGPTGQQFRGLDATVRRRSPTPPRHRPGHPSRLRCPPAARPRRRRDGVRTRLAYWHAVPRREAITSGKASPAGLHCDAEPLGEHVFAEGQRLDPSLRHRLHTNHPPRLSCSAWVSTGFRTRDERRGAAHKPSLQRRRCVAPESRVRSARHRAPTAGGPHRSLSPITPNTPDRATHGPGVAGGGSAARPRPRRARRSRGAYGLAPS